jgi:hypothetical protein
MGTAQAYLKKLYFVKNSIIDETHRIIEEHAEEIMELNSEEQWMKKGVDVSGNLLGRYSNDYEGETRGYPKRKGSPYNFFATGSLFDGMGLLTIDDKMEITNSDTFKVGVLEDLLGGRQFLGLTKENQGKVNWEIIYPDLMKFLNQHL